MEDNYSFDSMGDRISDFFSKYQSIMTEELHDDILTLLDMCYDVGYNDCENGK